MSLGKGLTAFGGGQRDDGSGKTDHYFSSGEKGDDSHGHVVTSEDADGNQETHYARDGDGNVYVDDSKE
jgi:hypothetical protein